MLHYAAITKIAESLLSYHQEASGADTSIMRLFLLCRFSIVVHDETACALVELVLESSFFRFRSKVLEERAISGLFARL